MSCSVLHTIPMRTIGADNKLYSDYIEDPHAGAGGCLQGFSQDVSFWRDLADSSAGKESLEKRPLWEDVVRDVVKTSARAGASQDVIDILERARDERVLFIVSGQQAGLFGGPLLTIYKALTTVAFADWLQSALAVPTIPLFWIAADDTDFTEIRSLFMLTPDMAPLSASLSDKAHLPGLPAGDIGIDFVSEAWGSIASFIESFPEGGFIRECISRSLSQARDNAEVFSSILSTLAGGRLAFVDGRSKPLRRFSRQLFSDYLEREDEVKRLIIDRGHRLQQSGYHSQLSPGTDSGIFLLEKGKRRAVPPDRISDLRGAIQSAVEDCSPGVVLRNLVQDYVFRPIAVVLGPAETAYRAQIVDAYRNFAIPRPAVIPRLAATYIPPPLAALLSAARPEGYESLIRSPSRFTASFYDQFAPVELGAALETYQNQAAQAADGLRSAAAGTIPRKLQKRLAGRLADIQRRIEQLREIESEAGKMKALELHPFLPNIEPAIRPENKPQERTLSCLAPYMFAGEDARNAIQECSELHIAELMDGKPCHIVYSV